MLAGAASYDPEVDPGSDQPFDLDLAAATLQANSSDVRMLLQLLVSQLSDVLGPRLVVERTGRLRRGDIKAVQATIGGDILRAEVEGLSLRCSAGHSSGGIRIRTDSITMDEWVRRLLSAVQEEAGRSEAARQALENIVIGGQP